ncbi:MAG: sigma-54 dependent transcriptional regulator [Acidobacteria bacterium]|nr:sigma-54 dependent transcriptional regulator [Acidobacteriota bacterium]
MNKKGNVLIVDDELIVRDSLGKWFREEGYGVGTAESAREALALLARQDWDVALVDIKMPDVDGIELQGRFREVKPDLIVIIMTGYASVETAVAALKNGAYDYVVKPFDPEEIAHTVHNALAHKQAERENVRLREAVAETNRPQDLIGQSAAMKRVFDAIETVGPTEATVLIVGESGTGKELAARAIHAASPRRYNRMVAIHCGALAETLLESELFGHEKGAFTGAQCRKKGSFEVADGGTVFLDEIGDISLKTQTDLLRVLQEREITRVGGNQPIHVDFRCVAATNKQLEKMIEEGLFRPDLYYRLSVFRIELPPLRARKEDVPPLVNHFIRKFSSSMNKQVLGIARDAMELLQQYDWPGNVRELENAVERAMVLAHRSELQEADFTMKLPTSGAICLSLEDAERAHILEVVNICSGNQTRAAELLEIDRVTLHNKLKKYGWKKSLVESS